MLEAIATFFFEVLAEIFVYTAPRFIGVCVK